LDFETLFSDFQELLNGSGLIAGASTTNLYQIHFSGCSALPESRRHSLSHPYSPLRATAFFRISRNWVQANNPHLNKSFGMSMCESSRNRVQMYSRRLDPARPLRCMIQAHTHALCARVHTEYMCTFLTNLKLVYGAETRDYTVYVCTCVL